MQFDMVRAWKDEEYRESLIREQQAQVLENPVGEVELSKAELEQISGIGGYGGGAGGGGIGIGGGVAQGYGFAGGIVGNSYFCGNYSYRPRTNLNLGEEPRRNEGQGIPNGITAFGSLVGVANSNRRDIRTNRFDFACSISGGIGASTCIFGGN